MKYLFILLLFVPYIFAQSFIDDELGNIWQSEDSYSLQLLLANEVRIFVDGNGGNYSRSKGLNFLQQYFAQIDVVAFNYNKDKSKKGVIVANYTYRKNNHEVTSLLYFFTSYNVWNKVNLIVSIREVPRNRKKTDSKISIDDINKSKEQLIDEHDDPQVMTDDMWEYTQTLSMGCHNVLYITKYIFKDDKVIKIDKQEIATGCEAEKGMW